MVGALCLIYIYIYIYIYINIETFTFLLCQLDSRVSTLVLFVDTECPMAQQWSPTLFGLSRFVV